MKALEIKQLIDELTAATAYIEEAYIENGGECTEAIAEMEDARRAIRDIIANEGIDSLGRWMAEKQAHKDILKAEKARIEAQIKADDNTIDYIKAQITTAMDVLGIEKAAGSLYKFTRYESITTGTDAEIITAKWGEKAEKALREAGIPQYINCKLGASVKLVPEGAELPEEFIRTSKPDVKFNKPRKA